MEIGVRSAVDILLVEDNPEDVLLLQRVLEQCRLRGRLHVVGSGEDALRFMRREEPYVEVPRPRLILLDHFLPGISGLDVLKALKSHPEYRRIPIIILTHADDERMVLEAYNEQATAFITKPGSRQEFVAVAEGIEAFWLQVAQLPVD